MRRIPDKPVYCTANGVKSLKGHYHQDWNFQVVKTGDKLSLGKKELIFVEAPMLHWPDTMFEYLTGDAILFSNDAFGQHIASEHLFNDLVDQSELFEEAIKYYANILTPFSPLVTKKDQGGHRAESSGQCHLPQPRRHLAGQSLADRSKISAMGGRLSGKSDYDHLRYHVERNPEHG